MFDWDEDYEELVQTRTSEKSSEETLSRSTRCAFRYGLVVLAAFVLIGAGYAGQSALRTASGSVDIVAAGEAAPPLASNDVLAPQLQVLDPAQAQSFQIGLRAFTDSHLLEYSGHAQRDHSAATEFMRPYLADAEALIAQELARRGL